MCQAAFTYTYAACKEHRGRLTPLGADYLSEEPAPVLHRFRHRH